MTQAAESKTDATASVTDATTSTHDAASATAATASAIPVMDEAVAPMLPDGRFTGIGVKGLHFPRRWTTPGVHPYDQIDWEIRTAGIGNEKGVSVFEQKDVEMPKFWSQMATNVVVSKYFRGHLGTPDRESSARQLIGRVVRTITQWGREGGYFATEADGDTFRDELSHILLYQMASFNSPVWFNVGH